MLQQYLSQLNKAKTVYKSISYTFIEYFIYYFKWIKTNDGQHFPIKDGLPWINFASLRFLDKIIKPSMKVFEFGAGGSSIFFANKVQKIISVEHDKSWFTNVEVEIAKRKLTNWEGYCVEPVFLESDIGSTNIADPKQYLSGDLQYKNFSFKSYASYIEKYDDNFFDMVFVDGRSRPSCLMHSFNKVKKGGYLVLDNADIDYYLTHFNKDILNGSFKLIFDKYGAGPYSSLFWETVVWQKIY